MAFIVVYDANAMYGNTPRDLLIRIARAAWYRQNGPKTSSTRYSEVWRATARTLHRRSSPACAS